MNAQELVSNLQVKGVRFERTGDDSFTVKAPPGLITAEVKELLTEQKAEIITLLSQTESQIEARFFKGLDCPRCRKPVEVITHPLDEEVWLRCVDPGCLIRTLHHNACEWCKDCGQKLNVIAGRCAECLKRVMLAPSEPCEKCGAARFWRRRMARDKPAGTAWHCAGCEEPFEGAVYFRLPE